MTSFDAVEATAFSPTEIDIREKMSVLNRSFLTKLTPENGIYGYTETVKDNGVVERLGVNEFGHKVKEYIQDGQIYKRREILGGGCNATTLFDDNGTAYLRTVTKLGDNQAKVMSQTLAPSVTIQKGNFVAVTDAYSRPVFNKVTDVQVRPEGIAKKSLESILRDEAYQAGDHKGHLIADSLGGPASKENIVAQLGEVNQGKMARVENIVRDLKAEGHTVDYEVKTNYVGSKDTRPSSFEPKITVDGKEVELPDDLKKIYNDSSDSAISKAVTTAGEKFGIAHETGVKSGLVAAGISCAVSTVDNVSSFIDGEITAEEMVVDIVEDTAVAGTLGYGTAFISTAVSQAMSSSSSALISKVGGSCVPAAVVAFAVESYEDISEYAQGKIDGSELAYNLGENAASVAGSFAGGALTGAAVGAVAGPVGAVAGTIVGGVVGCVVATEAYETAVELGAEGAEVLAQKANEFAQATIDAVSEAVPEKLEEVTSAFKDFASSVKLPFHI